ncbi:MAG: SOS response-associated peptidase [Acidimicrobiales bacterium]
MCGRFVAASPPEEIARYFGVESVSEQLLEPNWNVAPSTDVFVVYESGGLRRLEPFRWGLVPSWAKDLTVGYKMINARAETVLQKNAFRRPFAKRRCIIPVDGFYEWQARPGQKRKQPYFISRPDGEPLAFAGLWELWRPKAADGAAEAAPPVRSCTIITGPANDVMAPVHDRMPVVLPPSAWAAWLDPGNDDVATLGRLLVPAPNELMTLRPVGVEVNNVHNRGPHLIDAVPPPEEEEAAAG